MAKLIYSAITSLDGYIEDEDGTFDWAVPDEEVYTFINDPERPVGTYLYGRRMYEMMVGWESTTPSRRSGRRLTRACTPRRWRRSARPTCGIDQHHSRDAVRALSHAMTPRPRTAHGD